MNTLESVLAQVGKNSNELIIFEQIEEKFHPMEWLQAVGSFICSESTEELNIVTEQSKKTVRNSVYA